MPSFATVEADIRCPDCCFLLPRHLVGFQWGYCSVPYGSSVVVYRIGDPVLWRLDRNGSVPAWTYFRRAGGNIGDPAYADLLIRECELFGPSCPGCGQGYIDVGVIIKGGIIQEVRGFKEGLPECDLSLIGSGGTVMPRPEWNDHAMTIADGGDSERLVPHTALRA